MYKSKLNIRFYIYLFVFLLVTIIFEACSIYDDKNVDAVCSSNCTTVKGKFVTENGNVPVPEMELELYWRYRSPDGLFIRTRKIATTKTGFDGTYEISFFAKDDEIKNTYGSSYRLRVLPPKDESIMFLDYYDTFLFSIDKRDTTVNIQDYYLPKKGGKVNVKITNPQDIPESDRIHCFFSYKIGFQSNTGFGLNSIISFDNTYETAINQYLFIDIYKFTNNIITSEVKDSIIVQEGETRLYEVEY